MNTQSRVLITVATLVFAGGCASAEPKASSVSVPEVVASIATTEQSVQTEPAQTVELATPSTTAASVDPALPSTPAGDQLRWVLTEAAAAPDSEYETRFSDDFLANPGLDALRTGVKDVGRVALKAVASSTQTQLVVIVDSAAGELALTISVEADPPHRIVELSAQPAELPEPPATWEEIDAALAQAAPQISYLAAEVLEDGTLTTVRTSGAAAAVPLGSSFKIYVLGALVAAIEAGEIAWDDELIISEELKSLPSGELQDRPNGSVVTVQEAAEKMIQISDNTATDLLINRLGRDRVEAMLPIMGMGGESQQRTLPFITTRELFTLKWGIDRAGLAAYAAAGVDQRRVLLSDLAEQPLPSVADFVADVPLTIDTVEWFATPREMVIAHLWLDGYRTQAGFEPLAVILGDNPGVPLDQAIWPEVSFKGGSEPGVIFLGWLLHRADGRTFVVALSATNPDGPVGEVVVASAAQGMIELLAAS